MEAFYLQRVIAPAPDGCPLILTFDGKGIVMLPQALRPATAKAAASAKGRLATRLSPGEKNGRKRMAELADRPRLPASGGQGGGQRESRGGGRRLRGGRAGRGAAA